MIVLGIAPGGRNLAYCVLHYKEGEGWLPTVRLAELLKGIRLHGASMATDLQRKAGHHVKILTVVLERFPPTLIAVGPPALSTEPEFHTEAARFVLKMLITKLSHAGLPLRHMEWRTKTELAHALGIDKWRSVLDGRIADPTGRVKKPAVQIAAAAALAGGLSLHRQNNK